ncbi:hypothetical protein LIER_21090 [Lithospermum erythrorhizon]|uniref:Uncharacterized protein n=1 Tax=Lithospermum erythrorhizon TaxID=34254 RepID=A0AAV3QPW7_LITER
MRRILALPLPIGGRKYQVANAVFELARRADSLEVENKGLKTQVPSMRLRLMKSYRRSMKRSLLNEITSIKLQISQLSGYRNAAVAEVKQLEDEVKRLEDAASQYPKELWAAVENFKQSAEFEGALSAAVERFKKSPEFHDIMGANAAYGAYGLVRKYKEKCPNLRSDYEKFQEDFNSSWFAELSLDAPFEDEEEAPPTSDAAPKA